MNTYRLKLAAFDPDPFRGGAYTDAFTPGTRYAFALVKTVEVEDGRTATVESNKVYVTCVAA